MTKVTRYIESKVDYFNINKGDLCQVVEEDKIFVKVVKVGMTQVHYLYNFELQDVKVEKERVWEAAVQPLVFFLAATTSISAGRSYNDILLMIDGGEMPSPDEMCKRGDLAPTIFTNELFKLMDDVDVEFKDDLIDSLLDGHMAEYVRNVFIHVFYKVNYQTLKSIVTNWEHYRDVVKTAHEESKEA